MPIEEPLAASHEPRRKFLMRRLIPFMTIASLFIGPAISPAKDPLTPPPAKADKPLRLTDADNKKTVALPVGTLFDVALKGNASTGFQWQVGKIEGDAVRQTGKVDYVPDKHPARMVGFGGTFVFHFNVVKAAKTRLHLVYVRPWEKNKPPEKTFDVTIDPAAAADLLVFEGTVISIEASPLPKSTQNFIVTMHVDRVLRGQFKGKSFQFRVHSPAKSGLNVKGKYTVEAKRVDGKYTVDQNQWSNASGEERTARLRRAEVIAIAKAKAVENGIDLSKYDLKGCSFTDKNKMWTVFFVLRPPTHPGGHFGVSVDDRTKKATYMPGA
jgi:inhibitor of cysteine peptidase